MRVSYFKNWFRPDHPMSETTLTQRWSQISPRYYGGRQRTAVESLNSSPEPSSPVARPSLHASRPGPRYMAPMRLLSRVVSKAVSSFAREGRR